MVDMASPFEIAVILVVTGIIGLIFWWGDKMVPWPEDEDGKEGDTK